MKKTTLLLVFIAVTVTLSAQQRVALHSNGTTTIFGGSTPFVDAYNAAVAGDTIYLPGAALTAPSIIDKRLTIFGAGHYPDSTTATNKTFLSSTLTISENADSLFLEGMEINGNIQFSNNHKVDYVVISRCMFNQLYYQGNQTTPCEYNNIKECVINYSVQLDNANSCALTNNIIRERIYNGNNNAIYNNILLFNGSSYYYTLVNVDNSSISNNIFVKPDASIHVSCESSTFSNNIFGYNPAAGSNLFVNNYPNVDLAALFVNFGGGNFDYSYDFHLSNPSIYPGTDNTQVGIYGGLFPYKTSAVPLNPHIYYKNISSTTDANGLLNIEVSVSAQQD